MNILCKSNKLISYVPCYPCSQPHRNGKYACGPSRFHWHPLKCFCSCEDWDLKAENHDDVIKWKRFPRYWPFVWGIHRSPVNSPHKGQWRGALMFSLICAWTNGWVNNRNSGDLRRHHAHYDLTVKHFIAIKFAFFVCTLHYLIVIIGIEHIRHLPGIFWRMGV